MNNHNHRFKKQQILVFVLTLFLKFGIHSVAATQSVETGNKDGTNTETAVLPQDIMIDPDPGFQPPQQVQPSIMLRADKSRINVYEQVRFYLEPSDQVINTQNNFTFQIGDEIIELNNNQSSLAHRFSEAGRYVVSVSVNVQSNDDVFVAPQIVPDSLIIQVDSVGLVVSPVRVAEGESVTLRADFTPNGLDVQYRFFYGDGSNSDWDSSPRSTHSYSREGIYRVYAELRQSGFNQINTPFRSIARNVVVQPGPQPEVQVQALTLEADREEVYTGEEVRFTLNPSEVVLSTPFKFIFNFGDGNRVNMETGTAEMLHRYAEAGNYTVSITRDLNPVFANQNVAIPEVQNTVEIKVDSVPLIVNPPDSAESGEPVTFETVFRTNDPQIRYRFFFGDKSTPSEWDNQPIIEYTFTDPGTYEVYAQIGRQTRGSVDTFTSSVIKTVTVTVLDNGIPWWVYLIAAVLAGAGYYSFRNYKTDSPPLTDTNVEAFSDPGKQTLAGNNNLEIDYKIRLNPNFKEGSYSVYTNEPEIIKNLDRKI